MNTAVIDVSEPTKGSATEFGNIEPGDGAERWYIETSVSRGVTLASDPEGSPFLLHGPMVERGWPGDDDGFVLTPGHRVATRGRAVRVETEMTEGIGAETGDSIQELAHRTEADGSVVASCEQYGAMHRPRWHYDDRGRPTRRELSVDGA